MSRKACLWWLLASGMRASNLLSVNMLFGENENYDGHRTIVSTTRKGGSFMRARDLLTALTTTTQQEYQGIYLSRKETLVPFTTIAQDASGNLIFIFLNLIVPHYLSKNFTRV